MPPGRCQRLIVVAGNMGSGKTTLVEFLARRYGVHPFFEPNEGNPYLKDFYGEMERWAFHSQVYFLAHKVAMHRRAEAMEGTAALDRSLWEDAEIFATNLYRSRILPRRDYETYRALYDQARAALRPPDLLIYTRCSVRALRRRIRLRGRPEELAVPLTYVRRLHDLYEAWFERWDLSPSVIVPTDRLDYLTDLVHRIDLLETIERHLV